MEGVLAGYRDGGLEGGDIFVSVDESLYAAN